jgi:hypothetical protein
LPVRPAAPATRMTRGRTATSPAARSTGSRRPHSEARSRGGEQEVRHDRRTGSQGRSTTRPVRSGRAGPSGSPGLGRRAPDPGAAVGVRAATPALEPRDRLRGWPGRPDRWLPAAVVPTSEPLLLVADLLYALGWSLWTGVVVVLFVQIIPEVKRRQFKQMLDAYEAAQRDAARAGSEQSSGDDGAPTAS